MGLISLVPSLIRDISNLHLSSNLISSTNFSKVPLKDTMILNAQTINWDVSSSYWVNIVYNPSNSSNSGININLPLGDNYSMNTYIKNASIPDISWNIETFLVNGIPKLITGHRDKVEVSFTIRDSDNGKIFKYFQKLAPKIETLYPDDQKFIIYISKNSLSPSLDELTDENNILFWTDKAIWASIDGAKLDQSDTKLEAFEFSIKFEVPRNELGVL